MAMVTKEPRWGLANLEVSRVQFYHELLGMEVEVYQCDTCDDWHARREDGIEAAEGYADRGDLIEELSTRGVFHDFWAHPGQAIRLHQAA